MSTLAFIAGALFVPSIALVLLLARLLVGVGAWLGGVTLCRVPDRARNRAIHAAIVACADKAWIVQVGPIALSLIADRSEGERRGKVAARIHDALDPVNDHK